MNIVEIILLITNIILIIAFIALALTVRKRSINSKAADNGELLDRLNAIENTLRVDIANSTNANANISNNAISNLGNSILSSVKISNDYQNEKLKELTQAFKSSVEANAAMQFDYNKQVQEMLFERRKESLEFERVLRQELDKKLTDINTVTSDRLNEVKEVVDEKLSKTINERFNSSFKAVADSLEAIQNGFKKMQELELGVTDLNKMLSNVKTRGVWGENTLDAILEEVLTPEQYERNVKIKDNGFVDFAIILPGKAKNNILLPIDAKFPIEDYMRVVEASEKCDKAALQKEVKNLENAVKKQAKSIADKYIQPPKTTDFALMFVPTESLYAEILKIAGLSEYLQRECRVVIVGPSTVTALLNSLQLGFKTLAIQKSSAEIWKMFVQFRKDFGMFTDILDKAQRKIEEVNKTIEEANKRTNVIRKKLDKVEKIAMPEDNEIELGENIL